MKVKWFCIFFVLVIFLVLPFTSGMTAPTVSTESWQNTNSDDAPAGRYGHIAIWTDKEMIIWGGYYHINNFLNDGGRYNPVTDTYLGFNINN